MNKLPEVTLTEYMGIISGAPMESVVRTQPEVKERLPIEDGIVDI